MQASTQTTQVSKKRLWAGRIVSALAVLFMIFDGVLHLLKPAPVVESFAQLGYPQRLSLGLGIVELVCTALYVMPRTSVLGAILLTGYLGGAIAAQVRIDAPMFSTTLFPVYVAAAVWGGLYLRDERLRLLIPLRRSATLIAAAAMLAVPSGAEARQTVASRRGFETSQAKGRYAGQRSHRREIFRPSGTPTWSGPSTR